MNEITILIIGIFFSILSTPIYKYLILKPLKEIFENSKWAKKRAKKDFDYIVKYILDNPIEEANMRIETAKNLLVLLISIPIFLLCLTSAVGKNYFISVALVIPMAIFLVLSIMQIKMFCRNTIILSKVNKSKDTKDKKIDLYWV